MIEVFKTDVQNVGKADKLVALLLQHFPGNRINVDMHDCDRILRIEGHNFIAGKIMTIANGNVFPVPYWNEGRHTFRSRREKYFFLITSVYKQH